MCDLGAACILLHYSFLCFSMGDVCASLIKSVSHSGGFYSAARMKGGEERGRGRERWRGSHSPRLDLPLCCLRKLSDAASSTISRGFTGFSSGRLWRGCCFYFFKQYCLLCNIRLDTSRRPKFYFSITFVDSLRKHDVTSTVRLEGRRARG